eukprot:CAMPEP_0204320312 /NCGR_PEP_ID=MMETSP0469-20131031/7579_1 /ASSEMBLY_ACC=CAM_ASM_000384 /TAXON_ID=2969 /ORGANISM="Oxyrrhis marina" /LENGTH=106 /DNA_ID=CAMNT_0051301575 /DNA_START=364 /DNA_END=682 /DNA_ORIENTATION=-
MTPPTRNPSHTSIARPRDLARGAPVRLRPDPQVQVLQAANAEPACGASPQPRAPPQGGEAMRGAPHSKSTGTQPTSKHRKPTTQETKIHPTQTQIIRNHWRVPVGR